jgi:predicted O-methyltransferase YrrM
MHDTILHPLQAASSYRRYRANKRELISLLLSHEAAGQEGFMANALGGKINFPDAFILERLLKAQRPRRILEVGSFVGFSTRWLLDVSSEWNAHVTSVDPNIRHRCIDVPGAVLRQLNKRYIPERFEVVEGFFGSPGVFYDDYENYEPRRSRTFVDEIIASRQRITGEWGERFDFIFIDGEHSYEAVQDNFAIAERLLSPGGCIAFHDPLSWTGVREALEEIRKRFAGRARVEIFGKVDALVLGRLFGKHASGIGYFRALPAEARDPAPAATATAR